MHKLEDNTDVFKIIGEVLLRLKRSQTPILCNVSNRHVHLKQTDLEKLFGPGYVLKKKRGLVQPGEYAAHETIDIVGPGDTLRKVRVLGPVREFSQVEISRTDCYKLGIDAEVRDSGDITGTPGGRLVGPYGSVHLAEGFIVARRHVHMTPVDAKLFKIKNGQRVRIRTRPPRAVVFEDVVARVSEKYVLECHIDTDEANGCDLKNGAEVFLS